MKKLLLSLIAFAFINSTFAQGGAMADLKFEEAETAFSKNDYKATITKLNEFDKLYGSVTAKSLYLRIVSQNKLFVPNDLYENETQIDLLVSLRKNTSSYLKAMESEGLDDKFREVYDISEKLKRYPKDKAVWREQMEREERIAAEKIKIAEEKKQARLAKIKEYDVKKDQYYREIAPKIDAWEYKGGIKIGMDFSEFQSTHKDWLKGTYKTVYQGFGKKYSKKHTPNSLESIGLKDNKIIFYEFEISYEVATASTRVKIILDNLKAYFGGNLVFDRYSNGEHEKYYVIKSPYSKSKIIVYLDFSKIKILKMIGDSVEPQKYETHIDQYNKYSEAAYDLDYLDRYTGIYENKENGLFEIKGVENLPLLEMSRGKGGNIYWYFVRKKNTDAFVCSYKIVAGEKFSYDKDELLFNIEQNRLIIKFNENERIYTYTKEY